MGKVSWRVATLAGNLERAMEGRRFDECGVRIVDGQSGGGHTVGFVAGDCCCGTGAGSGLVAGAKRADLFVFNYVLVENAVRCPRPASPLASPVHLLCLLTAPLWPPGLRSHSTPQSSAISR